MFYPHFNPFSSPWVRAQLIFTLFVLLSLFIFGPATQAQGDTIDAQHHCRALQEVKLEVERILQINFEAKIKCKVRTPEEISNYVKEVIERELEPEKIYFEGLVLRALGMFPLDFAYEEEIYQIYQTALSAYYDPDEKALTIADWVNTKSVRGVLIHELIHALQDQKVGLKDFVRFKELNGDQILARMALVEGQATALTNFIENHEGRLGDFRSLATNLLGSFNEDFSPPFSIDFPEALQQLVQFPYYHGTKFWLQRISQSKELQIGETFEVPPRSTEEILNVEKSLTKEFDFSIPSPRLANSRRGRVIYSDVLGEFTIRVLLRALGASREKAVEGSKGWGGDLVEVKKLSSSEYRILWQTNWDSFDDKKEFIRAFSDLQKERSQTTSNILGHWGEIYPNLKMRVLGTTYSTDSNSPSYPVVVDLILAESKS